MAAPVMLFDARFSSVEGKAGPIQESAPAVIDENFLRRDNAVAVTKGGSK
jgi:hypothetical protein